MSVAILSMGASDPMTELSLNSLGLNKISLTNWDNSSIPEVMVGSLWSVGVSVIVVQDSAETITGLSAASDGLVCVYSDDIGAFSVSTVNTPTWDETRYGWYYGDLRCLMTILKSGASYTRKNILRDRLSFDFEKTYQKNIITGDISCFSYDSGEGELLISGDTSYPGSETLTKEFLIKKSISAYIKALASYNGTVYLYIKQNNTWTQIYTAQSVGTPAPAAYAYNIILNPGHYKIYLNQGGAGVFNAYLYCTGVYGGTSIIKNDILTEI